MTEHSDERDALVDIISLATFLSGPRSHAFSKEFIGSIADELRYVDTLLPEGESWEEETADDGSVVKRSARFAFEPYLGTGEEIPVFDELMGILDVDGFSSRILSEYHLPDNESLRAFCNSVINRSAMFLLEYRGEVGEFLFDVDEFPPRFGSGSSSTLDYEKEGSPHTTWDRRGVAASFLSKCADALRESAVRVVYGAYIDWVGDKQ